jgi:hypothetical protein
MAHKPRTIIEIRVHRIKKLLKQVESGKITLKEAQINEKLEKLKPVSELWHDELKAKYINMVKNLNK